MASDDSKGAKRSDMKPCDRCRSQHLKCVYAPNQAKCQRCEKSSSECVKSTKKIRFRDVPMSRLRGERKVKRTPKKGNAFTTSASVLQDGLSTNGIEASTAVSGRTGGQVSSTTAEADDIRDKGEDNNASMNFTSTSVQLRFMQPIIATNDPHPIEKQASSDTDLTSQSVTDSGEKEAAVSIPQTQSPGEVTNQMFPPPLPTPSEDRFSWSDWHDQTRPRIYSSERLPSSITSSPFARLRRASTRYLDQLVKIKSTPSEFIENVLLRYFHQELAPWFDLCDPDRHFATVVPQRARQTGPLRSAVLTIAARNMSRNKRFRNSEGIVEWKGRPIPELNEDFAVPYHNDCIRNLLQLSLDPHKRHDENLLAAVLALRTDEEMGYNSGATEEEQDQQLFLRIASVFIDAQLPPALALPHSSPTVFPSSLEERIMDVPSPSVHTDELGASGLRQACFWTAFRQDLHASFLKQQPVRFPLTRCEFFRQLTPATDAIWANRMVTFCADVLEFSYGSDSSDGQIAPSYTNQDRWRELRDREHMLCSLLPATFEPTYCSEPESLDGVFPEIWYLDPCHVSGTTYIELARMLLEVFNPTRPRLGHGFLAATNAFVSSTKKILFRLCGIALSNQHCPPSLINACLGIAMFGEYFEEPREQMALLGVLDLLHNRYAYPTSQIAHSLRKAWYHENVDAVTSMVPQSAIDSVGSLHT